MPRFQENDLPKAKLSASGIPRKKWTNFHRP